MNRTAATDVREAVQIYPVRLDKMYAETVCNTFILSSKLQFIQMLAAHINFPSLLVFFMQNIYLLFNANKPLRTDNYQTLHLFTSRKFHPKHVVHRSFYK